MRLTATQKAIGKLNEQKADIERAQFYIANGDNLTQGIDDIDRAIALLESIDPPPSADAPDKPKRKRKKKNAAE